VTREFGLMGANGIDFVARDGTPYAVEVNPRWCASMELVERAHGISVFAAHAAACTTGALPDFSSTLGRGHAFGKAVVFATREVSVGDTAAWLDDESVADIPPAGTCIREGRPVCTVFASASDADACYKALVSRATRIYAELRSHAGSRR
jgi:predicted ATP-grasp superfamily ATP-dependent carboligase